MRTWTTAAAIGCLLASSPASGLDSILRLTQYRHTAWRVQDGSFAAAPNAIAQTTDGYIWIGTGAGLVKYDGVRFAPWTAPGQPTPFSAVVLSLLGAADGKVTYGAHEVRLRIRDDGKGIDTKHLSAGRARHWGLAGMRERAARIGALLNLWSEVGAGTEVELRIPGSVAYGAPGGRVGVFRLSSRQGGGR